MEARGWHAADIRTRIADVEIGGMHRDSRGENLLYTCTCVGPEWEKAEWARAKAKVVTNKSVAVFVSGGIDRGVPRAFRHSDAIWKARAVIGRYGQDHVDQPRGKFSAPGGSEFVKSTTDFSAGRTHQLRMEVV